MKKLSTLLTAVLVSTMMSGQVSIDLNVIGRVDANPRFTFDGEKPSYNWANSSLYTMFETTVDDWFGFTMINHWAASDESVMKYPFAATPDLYRNSFTNTTNWVDYLYFDFMTNGWRFRIGKDCMAIGGFEVDDWDWDCTYDLCSTFWSYNPIYQWGASVAYTNPEENTTITLQTLSSPGDFYADELPVLRPWQKGFGSYFLQHDGSYGIVDTRNAIGFIQTEKNAGYFHGSTGVKVNILDELNVGVDVLGMYNPDARFKSLHALATANYAPLDKLEIFGKFGYERVYGENQFFGGVAVAYYPLKDSTDLRIQGVVAGRTDIPGLGITVGVTYNLPIHIL